MFGIPVILLRSFALILGIMNRSLGVSEQEPGIPDRGRGRDWCHYLSAHRLVYPHYLFTGLSIRSKVPVIDLSH